MRKHEFEYCLYRDTVKESKATVLRRKQALQLVVLVASLSGHSDHAAQCNWIQALGSSLNVAERRARSYQAELLLSIGDTGESV